MEEILRNEIEDLKNKIESMKEYYQTKIEMRDKEIISLREIVEDLQWR